MGLLMMLVTIGGLGLAFILLVLTWWNNLRWLRNFVFGAAAIWFGVYGITLFAVSLASEDNFLRLDEPKAFCGFYLDCHLHAAVTDVWKTKTLGDLSASGEFYIVTVKVSSDARHAKLGLLAVEAKVFDDKNRAFERDLEAEEYLGEQPTFEEKLSPLEAFEKEIVFDLPADAYNPRLDIREGYVADHLLEAVLIGDEDSIWHGRNYFQLEEQILSNSVKQS